MSHFTRPVIWLTLLLAVTARADQALLEEVLVTATRTGATDLQATPLAITAIAGETLEAANIGDLKGLMLLTPGISINQNNGWGQLYIRGIGTNNVAAGGDPSSTIYLDGVYLARSISVFTEFLDIAQLEVLRGPQGTLYGRNATGGTVNLRSNKATDEFSLQGVFNIDSENRRRETLVVNGPLADKVNGRLALQSDQRDGYVDNISPTAVDDELGNRDRQSVRLAFHIEASEQLSIDISGDYFERDENPPLYKPQGVNPEGGAATIAYSPHRDFYSVELPAHPTLPNGPQRKERNQGVAMNADWQLDDETLIRSVTGYRRYESSLNVDADQTPVDVLVSNFYVQQHQFSQELQLIINHDAYRLASGAFYFTETHDTQSHIELLAAATGAGLDQLASLNDITVETQALGLFADVSYSVTSRWQLLAGVRYSDEEKYYQGKASGLNNGGPHPPFDFDSKTDLPAGADSESWDNLSFKLGSSLQIDDSTLAYATLSSGFKSGGFGVFTATRDSYDEENITALELGLKAELDNGRTRLNTAVFYYDYSDLQIQEFVTVAAGEAPRANISNASDASVYGVELEMSTRISEQLSLDGSVAWLHTQYDNFALQRCDTCELEDVSGNALNSAPEWSAALAAQYRQPLAGRGELNYRLEWRWQDDVYYSAFNDQVMSQSDYSLVNANVGYQPASEQWSAQLYATNLLDEEYTNSGQDFSPTGVNLGINEPRIIGVKLLFRLE